MDDPRITKDSNVSEQYNFCKYYNIRTKDELQDYIDNFDSKIYKFKSISKDNGYSVKIDEYMPFMKYMFTSPAPKAKKFLEKEFKTYMNIRTSKAKSAVKDLSLANKIITDHTLKSIVAKQQVTYDEIIVYCNKMQIQIISRPKNNIKKYMEITEACKRFSPESANVYMVLGLGTTHLPNAKKIQTSIDKLAEQYSTLPAKSPTKVQFNELHAFVKTQLLSDNDKKLMYEEYLLLERVYYRIKNLSDCGTRTLEIELANKYVDQVAKILNIDHKSANAKFIEICAIFNIYFNELKDLDFTTCPFCEKVLIGKNIKSCSACNESFIVNDCWNCGQSRNIADHKICDCGVDEQGKDVFFDEFDKCSKLIKNKKSKFSDITKIYEKFIEDWKQAPSYRDTTIVNYKNKLEELFIKKDQNYSKYKQYIEVIKVLNEERKISEAHFGISKYTNDFPELRDNLTVIEVLDKYNQLQEYIKEAKANIKNNKKSALKSYIKALDISVDCREAIDYILNDTVSVPKKIDIEYRDLSVYLSWNLCPIKKAKYILLRKKGEVSTNINDGERLLDGFTDNFYEDFTVEAGVDYYYTLYLSISSIVLNAFVSSKEVVCYFNISNIRQIFLDGKIRLSWTTPLNASKVEVVRTGTSETKDPDTIIEVSKKGFIDSNLEIEHEYKYVFVCKYNKSGKDVFSKKREVVFTPSVYPSEISFVDVTKVKGCDYTVVLDKPRFGSFNLYFSTEVIDESSKKRLSETDFDKKYPTICEYDSIKVIESDDKDSIAFKIKVIDDDIKYFLPTIESHGQINIGKPFTINTRKGITDVKVDVVNSKAYINFVWKDYVSKVIILTSHESYIDKYKNLYTAQSVLRKDMTGEFEFSIDVPDNIYYCTFFSYEAIPNDHDMYISTRLDIIDNRLDIVVVGKIIWKNTKATIELEYNKDIMLPNVLLREVNLSNDDRKVITTFKNVRLKTGLHKSKSSYKKTFNYKERDSMCEYELAFENASSKYILWKE